MSYSKPVVTIDLDEYNELKKQLKDFESSDSQAKIDYLLEMIYELTKRADPRQVDMAINSQHNPKLLLFRQSVMATNANPFKLVSK